ncbi:unnamed protein product [Chrysoparadoxa australica]
MRATLSRRELERIKTSVLEVPEKPSDQRRKSLKALSDKRVENWPNTFESTRRKKESWKAEREASYEQKRREVDKREAELRRKMRMETIKCANDKLYEQTDKMKSLRSSMLYTEVIHTRKQQIEEKKKAKGEEKLGEQQYFEEMMEKIKKGEENEKEEKEARESKASLIAKVQQQQLSEFKEKYISSVMQEKTEGDLMKSTVREALAQERQAEMEKTLEAKKEMEKMLAANQDLRVMRAKWHEEELKEMEKCEAEKEVLESLGRARKALELKRHNERQAIRQRMIDRACEELQNRTKCTDERELRDAANMRAKEDALAEHKRQMQQRQKDAIEISRAAQEQRRKALAAAAKVEEARITEYYRKRQEEMAEQERQEKEDQRQRNLEIRRSQELQIAENAERRLAEKAMQLVEFERSIGTRGVEKDRFESMVIGQIAKAKEMGRDPYVLESLLAKANKPMSLAAGIGL